MVEPPATLPLEDLLEDSRCVPDGEELKRGLRSLLSSIPGVAYQCLMDEDWTMLRLSRSIEALTGYTPEMFLSRAITYKALIVPEDRSMVRDAVEEATAKGQPFQLAYRITTASGELRWFWERGQMVPMEVNGVAVLEGFITDISQLRSLEERNKQLGRVETLGLMAAGVLHDLGNLMTPIFAALNSAHTYIDSLPKDLQDEVRDGFEASQRSMALMRQMRRLTRETGRVGSCQPDRVIQGFQQILKRLMSDAHTLKLQLGAGSTQIAMTGGLLELVVLNLVINAVEASPEGCDITVVTAWIEEDGLRTFVLDVLDTGPGIALEDLGQVFEPLFSTKENGTGLGLANTRRLVESAGGQIEATSPASGPTRLRARIPALNIRSRPRFVLLLEPNPILCRLSMRYLKGAGCQVVSVGSLGEAERSQMLPQRPDTLLVGMFPPAQRSRMVERLAEMFVGSDVMLLADFLASKDSPS